MPFTDLVDIDKEIERLTKKRLNWKGNLKDLTECSQILIL